MIYSNQRPPAYEGRGDAYLAPTLKNLRRVLGGTQRDFAYATLRLGSDSLDEVAGILVDFAEDLHNGTGIWEAFERYNTEFFGDALPFVATDNGGGDVRAVFHPNRFRHFLWILYPVFIERLVLSPSHQDLQRIAQASSDFLADAFSAIPKDSGVKAFLRTPNERGWDVKKKLIWLGCHSFMFRAFFARAMENTGGKSAIGQIDDFVCQECTPWSGLGVIDILATVLDISQDDRSDLRSWYERHAAFYKLLSVSNETLEAVNVINDQPYRIRIDMQSHPFKRGQFIFGSLTPWRGEWYWSGEQRFMGDASQVDIADLIQTMKRTNSPIVCRYSKDYEAQTRERASKLHGKMLAFYGKDLVIYPDGMSMAADWQKELRSDWESRPKQEVKKVIEKHGLVKGRPEMNIPRDLLEQKDGLGVFLNPEEGKEVMTHFTSLIAGLKKKGNGLTKDEEDVIRGFFNADSVSPRFVRRVLEEIGDESVKAAFMLKGDLPRYWLDYLLRARKGIFYRKRYPSVSVI
ncbi:MAG: DUF3843 family protein [Planctomycetota bacterium]